MSHLHGTFNIRDHVNDDMVVNVWHDERVSDAANPRAGGEPGQAVGTVTTVEALKALADPLRLRLLSALMRTREGALPVMSVKELATDLGEPQTKLYRHVKQLEAVGLIRVAASRVVSGIVEHRYQACQGDLVFGRGLTEADKRSQNMEAAVAAAFELYRGRLFDDQRVTADGAAGQQREAYRQPVLMIHETRLPAAQAAAFRERLEQIIDELGRGGNDATAEADTVPVNILIGYFSPHEG
jgi:DNA-binding transcriptional ArsR family regulator